MPDSRPLLEYFVHDGRINESSGLIGCITFIGLTVVLNSDHNASGLEDCGTVLLTVVRRRGMRETIKARPVDFELGE